MTLAGIGDAVGYALIRRRVVAGFYLLMEGSQGAHVLKWASFDGFFLLFRS